MLCFSLAAPIFAEPRGQTNISNIDFSQENGQHINSGWLPSEKGQVYYWDAKISFNGDASDFEGAVMTSHVLENTGHTQDYVYVTQVEPFTFSGTEWNKYAITHIIVRLAEDAPEWTTKQPIRAQFHVTRPNINSESYQTVTFVLEKDDIPETTEPSEEGSPPTPEPESSEKEPETSTTVPEEESSVPEESSTEPESSTNTPEESGVPEENSSESITESSKETEKTSEKPESNPPVNHLPQTGEEKAPFITALGGLLLLGSTGSVWYKKTK